MSVRLEQAAGTEVGRRTRSQTAGSPAAQDTGGGGGHGAALLTTLLPVVCLLTRHLKTPLDAFSSRVYLRPHPTPLPDSSFTLSFPSPFLPAFSQLPRPFSVPLLSRFLPFVSLPPSLLFRLFFFPGAPSPRTPPSGPLPVARICACSSPSALGPALLSPSLPPSISALALCDLLLALLLLTNYL